MSFPDCSDSKESAYNSGDLGLIPGSGRFPGEGNGNPLQYSCLENSMNRGAWRAAVHGSHRVGHHLGTEQQQQQLYLYNQEWHPAPGRCVESVIQLQYRRDEPVSPAGAQSSVGPVSGSRPPKVMLRVTDHRVLGDVPRLGRSPGVFLCLQLVFEMSWWQEGGKE